MNLFILLPILGVFGYFACNLGSSSKPGHESYGWQPALYVLVVCLIGWLLWPLLGPVVMGLFATFGNTFQ